MEQPGQPKDWYAVVLRGHPEIVLVVDRYFLTRAWIVARLMFPEIGSGDLAFRTRGELVSEIYNNKAETRCKSILARSA